MRVLIAPDSFKGSLSALAAAKAMAAGLRRVFPHAETDLVPIADGGEGTAAALAEASGGSLRDVTVRGPLGEPAASFYGMFGDGRTVVAEMAAASGLPMVPPDRRDPKITCTYGTGELIRAALQDLHSGFSGPGRPRLILGIGGSATNDGGAGCMRALGARFLDAAGKDLPPGGAALARLASIDISGLDPLLEATEILIACDVDNPLCGPKGASAVFGPQKGASPEDVKLLDAALSRYADAAETLVGSGRRNIPGTGAAGGLGAAFLFFTNARLRPGVELVLDAVDFPARVAKADLVLTGEGHTDFQTAHGKAPVGVAEAAKKQGKQVVCLSGGLGDCSAVFSRGIDAAASMAPRPISLDECMKNAEAILEDAAERAFRLLRVGMRLGAPG